MPSVSARPTTRAAFSARSQVAWSREIARFIKASGDTTHSFGLGKLIGRLFALLYLTPAVRQLAAWNAVHKVMPSDGSVRRDYYQAELRFGVILRNGLLPGVQKKLHSAGAQIDRTLGVAPGQNELLKVPAATSEQHQEICRRLRLARGLYQKVHALFSNPLLEHLL